MKPANNSFEICGITFRYALYPMDTVQSLKQLIDVANNVGIDSEDCEFVSLMHPFCDCEEPYLIFPIPDDFNFLDFNKWNSFYFSSTKYNCLCESYLTLRENRLIWDWDNPFYKT